MRLGYGALLAVAATAAFFSNVSLYLFESKLTEVPPLWWMGAVAVLALPLAVPYGHSLLVPTAGIIWWALGYLLVSLCWFAFFPTTADGVQEMRNRLLSVGLIALMWLIVQQRGALAAARWTILGGTLFAAGMNLFEFVFPGTYSTTIGRAAGLYMNPNVSGAALVLGMLVSADLLRPWWRIVLVAIVGLAVMATFSRAAIAAWLLVSLTLMAAPLRAMGAIRALATVAAAVAATGVALGYVFEEEDAARTALRAQVLVDRLGVISGGEKADLSANERRDLVEAALESVAGHPWAGSGLGANKFSSRESGSHNLYLDHAAQHGIAGVLLLPALALALVAGTRGSARANAMRVAFFLLLWALFSHNVLEEFYLLTALVIQAAVFRESAVRRPPEVRP